MFNRFFYSRYDDENDDDDTEESNVEGSIDYYYQPIQFFDGEYSIGVKSVLSNEIGKIHATFIIGATNDPDDCKKSLLEVFECFENTYFLEFMEALLVPSGVIDQSTSKKLLSIDADDSELHCIIATATFNTDQNYIQNIDEVKSEESVSDIIIVNKGRVMRNLQLFFSQSQPIRYATIKLDILPGNTFTWKSPGIDWWEVYSQFIQYNILLLKAVAIGNKYAENELYKSYIDFSCQFIIQRDMSSLLVEAYLLPISAFGRKIYYSSDDPRLIKIQASENDTDISYIDKTRIALGNQNPYLLPLGVDMMGFSIIDGDMYYNYHEVQNGLETIINRYLFDMYAHTNIPPKFVVHEEKLFPFWVPLTLSEKDKEYAAKFKLTGFRNSITGDSITIDIGKLKTLGILEYQFAEEIPTDILSSTMYDDEDESFMPKQFYDLMRKQFKLSGDKFILVPYQAFPTTRKFSLTYLNENYKDESSEANIISTDKTTNEDDNISSELVSKNNTKKPRWEPWWKRGKRNK